MSVNRATGGVPVHRLGAGRRRDEPRRPERHARRRCDTGRPASATVDDRQRALRARARSRSTDERASRTAPTSRSSATRSPTSQDNVELIRRQVLLAGGIALVIAILAGYLVARALAARVKRLERAARKVAAGDFSQPIKADSDDELGRLAAAFNDMQDQLARLDRARKQFIASASHELRTPIFSLGGFLELLADEDLDEETRRAFLEQIRGQVDRMRNLAVELLDLSRLEAGALELRPEPTDVGQLAREVAAEFTPAAARHESEVTLDLRPEPIELDCDPERVAQVLRILLDNALRHTPPGTGVRVSAARANGHVRLEVSDRGLGINRQNMPHIFEPFFTSQRAGAGRGAGPRDRPRARRAHAGSPDRALRSRQDDLLAGPAGMRRLARSSPPRSRSPAAVTRRTRRRDRRDRRRRRRASRSSRARARAASTRRRSTRPRRRAWSRSCRCSAPRAARAPASCSTARARSSPTPTSSPPARASAIQRANEVYVEFADGNRVRGEGARARPERGHRAAAGRSEGAVAAAAAAGRQREGAASASRSRRSGRRSGRRSRCRWASSRRSTARWRR